MSYGTKMFYLVKGFWGALWIVCYTTSNKDESLSPNIQEDGANWTPEYKVAFIFTNYV